MLSVYRYLQKQRNNLQTEVLRLREADPSRRGTPDVVVASDDQRYLVASGEQRIRSAISSERSHARQCCAVVSLVH